MTWQHNADKKFRSKDALPSLGTEPDRGAASLHWAYQSPIKARMGGKSPLRRLDGLDVDIKSGDRVFIDGQERLGFGWACGPVTLDNESIWLVALDSALDWEEVKTTCVPYSSLRRSHDV
jgi:hypothetical protein